MKPTTLTTHLVCCAVGIAIGSTMLGPRANRAPQPSAQLLSPPAVRVNRSPSDAKERKLSAARVLARSAPPPQSDTDRKKWLESLPISDLSDLIEGMCQNLGPNGMNYRDRPLLDSALERWLNEDKAGLLSWMEKLPAGGLKSYLMSKLMETLLESDPDQAIAMGDAYQAEDPEWSFDLAKERFLNQKIGKAWERPDLATEEILSLYEKLPRGVSPNGSRHRAYPQAFDFEMFLDRMISGNMNDKKFPHTLPMDVLETWARRDPQAAAQWFLKSAETGVSVPWQDWSNIAKAISETSGVQSYHKWVGELLPTVSNKQLEAIATKIEIRDAMGISAAIPTPQARDRVLAVIVERFSGGIDVDPMTQLIGGISDSQLRRKAIKDQTYRFGEWLDDEAITPAHLQQLGLSEAELREVIGK